MNSNDERVVANIRCLGIDIINEAKSGHPGIALGAAPIIYSIYANHLRFSSVDDRWINRDRFVMSAGHGSALLYAMLYMAGFNLSIDDLKKFRQLGSKTPGHPEVNITPGVDVSTGPLGQGLATGVGIALGERYINNLINKYIPNQEIINYNTYVLCGDGDLMEGVSYESASFAGTQKLGKLIVLYDSNDISLDGPTHYAFRENIQKRFEAMGWHYELVKNGEDLSDISRAIDKAKEAKDKPSIIEVKTKIGFGSSNEGNNSVHGKPLNEEDIISLKTKLRIPNEAFYIDEEGKNYLIEKIKYRVDSIYTKWASNYNNYKLNEEEVFEKIINPLIKGELTENFTKLNLALPNGFKEEVRASNMRAINYFAKNNLSIVGGSADLSSSTKGYIGSDEIERMDSETPIGRNIYFGVREHAMGAILNGLALTGLRPFGSTFLSFADYLKPAIRMSALMNLPVTYIFTHDSIAVGPDGPTHQPIEQMAMLRSIPNFEVYRPADINETFGSWLTILNNKCPSALIINKGEMESLLNTNYEYVKYGAYMVKKETSKLDAILVATGKELKTAMNIANELLKENIDLRVVSMPSLNLYLKNTEDYKNALLPDWAKVIVIEAGSPYGWEGITGFNKIIGVDTFGYSGKPDDVLKKMSFDYESIKDKVKSLL